MTTAQPAHAGQRSPALSWALVIPRGVAQIFFQDSVWTGLLILVAFLVADWRMCLLVLIGAVCSTAAGWLLRVDPGHFAIGFQGFNGALVGAAAFTALGGHGWAYVVTVLGGLACAPVTWFVDWLFASPPLARFALPSTTAPFCTVAGVAYVLTTHEHVRSSPQHVADGTGGSALRSLLTNVSEVVLVNSAWSGALILVGLFLASWKVGLAALLGSGVGTLCALGMGESDSTIEQGLSGYSGVLTAIALATVFLVGRPAAWLYAVIGTAITAVVTLAMTDWYGDPHYTWPYILTTWVLLIAAGAVPTLRRT